MISIPKIGTKFLVTCPAYISKISPQIKILWPELILSKDFILAGEIMHDQMISIPKIGTKFLVTCPAYISKIGPQIKILWPESILSKDFILAGEIIHDNKVSILTANLSAFRTFVRFALVWFCLFPLPLSVWEGLRFVIVALPGLFSYLFLNWMFRTMVSVLYHFVPISGTFDKIQWVFNFCGKIITSIPC